MTSSGEPLMQGWRSMVARNEITPTFACLVADLGNRHQQVAASPCPSEPSRRRSGLLVLVPFRSVQGRDRL